MKRLFILFILMPWTMVYAHPGGLSEHNTPEARRAHAELLAESIQLINCIQSKSSENTPRSTTDNITGTKTNSLSKTGTALPSKKTPTDEVRVTVLGYHQFSSKKKATEMLMPTKKFRKQMQAIKDLGLNVITLQDFLAWKRGEKKIKDHSVLITIDDGWKSVYTDAFPILKEFGYPFTVFLYTNYIDGGGKALTVPMIREMQKFGCTIGSHSMSHPAPQKIRAYRKKGRSVYDTYLKKEIGQSKKILEKLFKQDVKTYAYPGGIVTEEMFPIANESGYQCLFTVLPGKVHQSSNALTLPRYIILGTHDYIFRNATSFKATSHSAATLGGIVQSVPFPVTPEPGKKITDRMPLISANLSHVESIDPKSIVMRVAGFGKVPAHYDPASKTVSWKVPRPLRSRTCKVSIQWNTKQQQPSQNSTTPSKSSNSPKSHKRNKPTTWIFLIDKENAYQPHKKYSH